MPIFLHLIAKFSFTIYKNNNVFIYVYMYNKLSFNAYVILDLHIFAIQYILVHFGFDLAEQLIRKA